MEEQEGRNWLNMSIAMLRKCREQGDLRLQYFEELMNAGGRVEEMEQIDKLQS